jgi:alpha-tubulin suppressor-like RCC1 family protein
MLMFLVVGCLMIAGEEGPALADDLESGDTTLASDTSGPWLDLESGDAATCAIDMDGALTCWGDSLASNAPDGLFLDVAMGLDWACGLLKDGTPQCWGNDDGIPTGLSLAQQIQVEASDDMLCSLDAFSRPECWGCEGNNCDVPRSVFADLAVSSAGACAVRENGEILCWGQVDEEPPVEAIRPREIDGGEAHFCARWHDDVVQCWGDNSYGQTDVPNTTFVQVTAGAYHSCGLLNDGRAMCWGQDVAGETEPPDGVRFLVLSAGTDFTCGITTEDEVQCWGSNVHGVDG